MYDINRLQVKFESCLGIVTFRTNSAWNHKRIHYDYEYHDSMAGNVSSWIGLIYKEIIDD